jgi:AcrR family transcriptional regulator
LATTDSTRTPKGRAPHRRDENARLAVLHAADDLLVERGFGGVTIEGIAARAGVAKQTIYRWWHSKVDILLDTLIDDASRQLVIGPDADVPDADVPDADVPDADVPDADVTAIEAVRRYVESLARFLSADAAGKVLLALIGEAQHDAEMARTFHERYLGPQRERERALLQRGIASGELPAGLDVDAALDALCGPIFYRALTGADIPQAFTDRLVADVLERHVNDPRPG